MLVKLVSIALAVGVALYLFWYLPKRLKRGPGMRLRYIIFSAFALICVFLILKKFF